jgi:hypothetical protein
MKFYYKKIDIMLRLSFFFFLVLFTQVTNGQVGKPYAGYRVYLANLEILKHSDNSLRVAFRTVNTGRQDLEFGKGNTESMQKMVVRFDPIFENGKMQPYLMDIIASLKQEDFTVVAGKISDRREMEVPLNFASSGASPAPSKILLDIGSPNKPESTSSTEIAETSIEKPLEKDFQYYDPETCPDLRIETIKVVKQKKNYVIIQYTIKNVGKGPANIEGNSKGKEDNIAVKAFMTSSEKLNKGALVLGGDLIENRSKNAGALLPGETHTSNIRLDINTMTKFTPVIILELDTFGQVRECDETNNKNHIKVR